ncbi:MAG: nitroreductase [Clostridia bacterium]|nr:nitroreductase [Clostridia bacterium]
MNRMFDRKSVRTYDGRMLTEEDRAFLSDVAKTAENPWGIPVDFCFLDPKEHGLKSPVLNGETLYLAAKVRRVPHFEEAYGYSFESVVIRAWERGIGTVWIGGTMNRENFENAVGLKADEVMPCVTPVGYPAGKRSLRETVMRKGVRADWRYGLGEIAFEDEAGKPLSAASAEKYGEALEAVRRAPSAVNKQPWRIVVSGGTVCFYEKPDTGYVRDATGDLQRIDVGIAMYHFVRAVSDGGGSCILTPEKPEIPVPVEWKFVAAFQVR